MSDYQLIRDLIQYEKDPHSTIDKMNVNKERKVFLHAELNAWMN